MAYSVFDTTNHNISIYIAVMDSGGRLA